MGNEKQQVPKPEIDTLYETLNKEAESAGYHLNPDGEFTKELIEGLIINKRRYGYGACPCRLASGKKKQDLDIICPCDYRDPDLTEYDTCYCGLYVSSDIIKGLKVPGRIPERRRSEEERKNTSTGTRQKLAFPVWRCRVCGYLCARDDPPESCPICKAKKERFEGFMA